MELLDADDKPVCSWSGVFEGSEPQTPTLSAIPTIPICASRTFPSRNSFWHGSELYMQEEVERCLAGTYKSS